MSLPGIHEAAALDAVRSLLPWYAADTLAGAERQFVADWLADHGDDHPDITTELNWLRRTAQQTRELAAAQLPAADAGLNQLLARIGREPARPPTAAAAPASPLAAPPSPWQRLSQWLADALAPRPVLAFGLVAVLLVQVAVISGLLSREPAEQQPLGGSSTGTGQLADRVILAVAFSATAREADMRLALQRAQGQIIAGPSALGLYRVAVPKAQAEAAEAALRASAPTVESVQREP